LASAGGGPRNALIIAKIAKTRKTKPIIVSTMHIGGDIFCSGEAATSLGCSKSNMKKRIIFTICPQMLCLLPYSKEKDNVTSHE